MWGGVGSFLSGLDGLGRISICGSPERREVYGRGFGSVSNAWAEWVEGGDHTCVAVGWGATYDFTIYLFCELGLDG